MSPQLPRPPRFGPDQVGPSTVADWNDLYRWFVSLRAALQITANGAISTFGQAPVRGVAVNELDGLVALLLARPSISAAAAGAVFGSVRQYFTSTPGQTTFACSPDPAANCLVLLNGVVQESGADYNLSGSNVVFTYQLQGGWRIGVIQ